MTAPDTVERVLHTVVVVGLRMTLGDLSEREIERQRRAIRDMLKDYEDADLLLAIKYGMPDVWPFSQDSRPFDAHDLRTHLLKAMAAARQKQRAGEIPVRVVVREEDGA